MKPHTKEWYKLDNAAKLYPSIASTRVSTVFRVSATLYKKVNVKLLQKALNRTIDRFPYYKVHLKFGLFWYYYEYTKSYPQVEEETFYPCMFLLYKNKKTFPFRVLYYKNRISVEVSHSITDGNGAVIFLGTLLCEYFRLLGYACQYSDTIYNPQEEPQDYESEDAFHQYYTPHIPNPPKLKKAFHFPFKLNTKGEYHIITGILSSDLLYQAAKKYNATVTQFLLALYFDAIQDFLHSHPVKNRHPVVLNIPVNLRKLYPSKTMRNFFVSITPKIDFRLGHYSFTELLDYVQHYMSMTINDKNLQRHIHRNVENEKNLWIRLIPLPIKNLLMPTIYYRYGERNYTSSISNLGQVSLPPSIAHLVERLEFYPPPSRGNMLKVGVVTYSGHTYISFGSLTPTTELERLFFCKIRKMNIPIKIETNRE